MRLKGLFWILTTLLLTILAVVTYYGFLYVFYPDVFRGRSLGLAYDHLFICLLSPYHKALAYHR
mgnify:CR=1 FL=1